MKSGINKKRRCDTIEESTLNRIADVEFKPPKG
jgi:hypothetical protein